MTESLTVPQSEALKVGDLLSQSMAILTGQAWRVCLLMVVSAVPPMLSLVLTVRYGELLGSSTVQEAATRLLQVVGFVATSFSWLMVTQLAQDSRLGRGVRLRRYVGPALRRLVPASLLALVCSILVGLGMMALVLPGLWLAAVLSVVWAALVLEGRGFGAIKRSAALTRDYRWSIVGFGFLSLVVFVLAYVVILLLTRALISLGGFWVAVAVNSLFQVWWRGYPVVAGTVLYLRLCEIKEGAASRDVAAIFD